MTIDQKIAQLKQIIHQQLTPLIQSDYVLWALPYHENIGDTLIWQGELAFLEHLPHRCKGTCGWNRMEPNVPLAPNTTILLHGGGFIGDVWREAWSYMLNILTHYAQHPIVLLPNTLYYNDTTLLKHDAQLMSRFSNLTICVRDERSYQLATQHFTNPVRLVPDMAFCIPTQKLRSLTTPPTRSTLLLKRKDKEAVNTHYSTHPTIDTHDWPTVSEALHWQDHCFNFLQRATSCSSRRLPSCYPLMQQIEALWTYHIYRPYLIRRGVNLLSSYEQIVTTRLHGLILSMLLNKPVKFIDNSYGKLSTFYNTWLTNTENVAPFEGEMK